MISRCNVDAPCQLGSSESGGEKERGETHSLAVGDLGVELVRQDVEQVELDGAPLLLVAVGLLDVLHALEQELARLLGEAGELLEEKLRAREG